MKEQGTDGATISTARHYAELLKKNDELNKRSREGPRHAEALSTACATWAATAVTGLVVLATSLLLFCG